MNDMNIKIKNPHYVNMEVKQQLPIGWKRLLLLHLGKHHQGSPFHKATIFVKTT